MNKISFQGNIQGNGPTTSGNLAVHAGKPRAPKHEPSKRIIKAVLILAVLAVAALAICVLGPHGSQKVMLSLVGLLCLIAKRIS